MTAILAHVLCIALAALDLVIRAWRTKIFLAALREPLPFREVFIHGAIGEAASSLTPLRLGGEPARVWAMSRAGVSATAAMVCVGVELLATIPVILLVAAVLGFAFAPEWWMVVGPGLIIAAVTQWPVILALVVVSLVAWWLARRLLPDSVQAVRREIETARAHARDLPLWVYLVNIPLTVAQIASRVAILPVLALTLPSPPPLFATILGSFVLLYGQALIPTPAGAGAVELGFVEGAAGELGVETGELLIIWRLYTTLLGLALGVAFAVYRYGWSAIPIKRRQPPREPSERDAERGKSG